jgi:enoyl-[acyl-carrier protein] reductase II
MNRVCELLGVEIPILQAPMTFIANAQLASAVSNAGALGVIETSSPQGRADLKRVRHLTTKPVAANIALVVVKRDPAVVDVVAEAGVKVVTVSSGSPELITKRLQELGIKVFHVVGTLRAAMKACDAGVDGLIAEGIEGGGFKDRHGASTMVLLPLIASRVNVPIVAAGGICDARSMAAAFVLGAEAVQMGTRMLASVESPVHDHLKQAIVASPETGTVLVSIPGLPTMRVLRTGVAEREHSTRDMAQTLATVQKLYFEGEMLASFASAGQVAGRIERIQPVAEIIDEIWSGCREALASTRLRLGCENASGAQPVAPATRSSVIRSSE